MDERRPRRRFHLFLRRVGLAVQEVLPDRRVEEVRLLRDHPDDVRERRQLDLSDVHAVDLDRALAHVVHPRDEVGHGGLAGAARTDQRGELTRLDLQVDVLQRPRPGSFVHLRKRGGERQRFGCGHLERAAYPVAVRRRPGLRRRVVPERDVPEGDRPVDRFLRDGPRVRQVDDVERHVEVFEDPMEQSHRRLDLDADLEHLADGEEQPRLKGGERDDRPGLDRDLTRGLMGDHDPRHQIHQRRRDRKEDLHDGEEVAAHHRLADLQAREAFVLLLEAADLVRLSAERLRQEDAGHRQRLLADRADLRQRLLGPRRDLRDRGWRVAATAPACRRGIGSRERPRGTPAGGGRREEGDLFLRVDGGPLREELRVAGR